MELVAKKIKLVKEGSIPYKVSSPNDVAKCINSFGVFSQDEPVEHFVMLGVNNQNKVEIIKSWEGGIDENRVYVGEVAKYLLLSNCRSVIFCHNHPSGAVKFSDADILVTKKLKQALSLLDIQVLDHVLFPTGGNKVSMAATITI